MIKYCWKRLLHSSRLLREEPRVNQVGIQYLSKDLHGKVFPKMSPEDYAKPKNSALLELAKAHLKQTNLLGKKTQLTKPIVIDNFPELVGKNTLDEHFSKIGARYSEPYFSMAKKFFAEDMKLPKQPSEWVFESGWTRYAPGMIPEKVDVPLEDELVFDVEVPYKKTHYPVIATAVSSKAWYAWVSPIMTSFREGSSNWNHLLPLETHTRPKLLVGYNVSYDRARVKEEYSVKRSKAFFMDAMAFHIATSGFCSQQRPLYQKHKKNKKAAEAAMIDDDNDKANLFDDGLYADEVVAQEVAQGLLDDPWLNKGSPNSLANAAEFHCGIHMNKDARDFFATTDLNDIINNFQHLMTYCAHDVYATYKVTQKLFPEFCRRNPHPVSFAALRSLGSLFLPTSKKWDNYIKSAERVYQENREQVSKILVERVDELIRYIVEKNERLRPDYENDPWLKQMNWEIKHPRIKKDGTPFAKQAYMTGYPAWYRDLFKTVKNEKGESCKELNLTVRTRITPLLLRLKWEGYPLLWTDSVGWCFKVPNKEDLTASMEAKNYTKANLSEEDRDKLLPELQDDGNCYELFKIPHPAGLKNRCTLIMSKSYLRYFESGVLTSEFEHAAEILSLNATASYWMGNRSRITEQFVVYADKNAKENKFFDTKKEIKDNENMAMILPKLCTMGTVTRRATENTWLTASNAKANRIGSELKAMIQAPKNYVFVGADVDSEELWIASLIGDSLFKIHGGTALGWMTLEGDKNEKTDLHSKTADIMGISRNEAKVFNYGRIYGAGVKFATQLLKQCNASIDDDTAVDVAKKLYERTKGQMTYTKIFGRKIYHGGTESVMFNALESIAYLESPKTPVLGASITDALTQKYLNKNNYLTSRINWTIQSSGVDYLHLLIVSMEYLIEKYKIDARLMITVHDELRYMVREDQKLLAVMLMQISNVWTRAMFSEQMGIKELPQSCAFFSEVDVDFVLRKEVGLECITPSHPESIPPGESFTIQKLMNSCDIGQLLGKNSGTLQKFRAPKFDQRTPVIRMLDGSHHESTMVARLRLQNSVTKKEWTESVWQYRRDERAALMSISAPAANENLCKSRKGNATGKTTKPRLPKQLFANTEPTEEKLSKSSLRVESEQIPAFNRKSAKVKKKLRKGIVDDVNLTREFTEMAHDDLDNFSFTNSWKLFSDVEESFDSKQDLTRRPQALDVSGIDLMKSELKGGFVSHERQGQLHLSSANQRRSWSSMSQPWISKKDPPLFANLGLGRKKVSGFGTFKFVRKAATISRSQVFPELQSTCERNPTSSVSDLYDISSIDLLRGENNNFKHRHSLEPVIKQPFERGRRRH